ncbi:hypothetical protein ACX9MO_18140 [Pseudooceanicola sp. 502str34]|uniref:hypothetical protein n=1 Tax=Maritimibacter alkaliphilus TaxID=404236 RepID=UPI001C97B690|nr:hypothetical protein [Maritimibacter alkaliphilus]MBY6089766.1 hypothetical protein [Maritimibacter alkaliphilus]
MIELLVIVGLATIGIVFTSNLEAEAARNGGRRKKKRRGEESEGGLGIFGLDIARKLGRKPAEPLGHGTAVRPFEECVEESDVDDIERRVSETLAADRRESGMGGDAPIMVPVPDPALADVAIIEDFNPDEDRIVVGYDPEAGNARIHFQEDPDCLGDVRVLMNDVVVAVVPDGLGRVGLRHIELVPFDEMDVDEAA